MSLEMHLGERRPALKPQPEAASVIHLETPVLNEAELAAISEQGLPVKTVSTQVACLLYTSPSPRDATLSRMPSSA